MRRFVISRALNITITEAETVKRNFGINYEQGGANINPVVTANLNFIFSEANRVLLNFEKKYNKTINNIILTGGGVNLKGFYELAQKSFSVSVVVADPFSKVEAPAFHRSE
jgi:cell division ATPase FtsA